MKNNKGFNPEGMGNFAYSFNMQGLASQNGDRVNQALILLSTALTEGDMSESQASAFISTGCKAVKKHGDFLKRNVIGGNPPVNGGFFHAALSSFNAQR